MLARTLRISSATDVADIARGLETPSEVRRFEGLASQSERIRAFLETPEWRAIRRRIVGDGTPPLGVPGSLDDLVRFLRWTADGAFADGPLSEDARRAYLHAAVELDAFARRQSPTAPVRQLRAADTDDVAA